MSGKELKTYNRLHYKSDDLVDLDSEIRLLYDLTEANDFVPDTRDAWNSVQSRITPRNSNTWMRIAASFIILATFGLILFIVIPEKAELITVTSGGAELIHNLPDGSTITLNENSSLTYKDSFEKNRSVTLIGEGYFEVVENTKNFTVTAGNSVVKVIGTSFNVKHSDDQTEVYVTSGIVKFGSESQQVQLTANEYAVLSQEDKTLQIDRTPDENLLAWYKNQFVFNNTTVLEVIGTLENYFGKTIALSNKSIGRCNVSGTFDQMKLSEILESICIVLDLKLEYKKNQYFLKGKGC